MLVVETIAKIRRAHFIDGKSIKRICRELRVSRNAVRKVIRSGATEFTYDRSTQPRPKMDPWRSELDTMLAENARRPKRQRLTLVRINEELRNRGYGGGYDAVRRYGASWSKATQEASASACVPLSFDPGEAYQFDWSHEVAILDGVTTTVKVAHDHRAPRPPHPPLRDRRNRHPKLALQKPRKATTATTLTRRRCVIWRLRSAGPAQLHAVNPGRRKGVRIGCRLTRQLAPPTFSAKIKFSNRPNRLGSEQPVEAPQPERYREDASALRGVRPFVLAELRTGIGVEQVIAHLARTGGLGLPQVRRRRKADSVIPAETAFRKRCGEMVARSVFWPRGRLPIRIGGAHQGASRDCDHSRPRS